MVFAWFLIVFSWFFQRTGFQRTGNPSIFIVGHHQWISMDFHQWISMDFHQWIHWWTINELIDGPSMNMVPFFWAPFFGPMGDIQGYPVGTNFSGRFRIKWSRDWFFEQIPRTLTFCWTKSNIEKITNKNNVSDVLWDQMSRKKGGIHPRIIPHPSHLPESHFY